MKILRNNDCSSLSKCLKALSTQQCKELLNTFLPISERMFSVRRPANFKLTLFIYALLFSNTQIVQKCTNHGGQLSVEYPKAMLGPMQRKHTITAGQGALDYYDKILFFAQKLSKRSKRSKHSKKMTRSSSSTRKLTSKRTLTQSRRSFVYNGWIPIKRFMGNLFHNLTTLQCMKLPQRERKCLDALQWKTIVCAM